jgi:hypothetical protein
LSKVEKKDGDVVGVDVGVGADAGDDKMRQKLYSLLN